MRLTHLTIPILLIMLLAGCATTPPTEHELESAAARSRASDNNVMRLQVQDLCWRLYDGKHGCYLPP